jgi:hypothetical protein
MKYIHFILLAIFNCCIPAFACNAAPDPPVKESFNIAKDVYLALATSKSESKKSNATHSWVEEDVVFEILQVWKGSHKVGEKIKYNTVISSGCGISIENLKYWKERQEYEQKYQSNANRLSGIWLIYASEANENSLWPLGRTRPLEYGGYADLRELYGLSEESLHNKQSSKKAF